MIFIETALIKKKISWSSFKEEVLESAPEIQILEDQEMYCAFFNISNFTYYIVIWKSEVPWAIALEYSQEQNDLDKQEFEEQYINEN